MVKLWIGVLLFGGVHLLPMLVPTVRSQIVSRIGENAYKGIYSLAAVAGLVFLAMGYMTGRSNPASEIFYGPNPALRHLTLLLVLAGFILIFSNGTKGYIRKYVRHPFSWGVILWSTGHLLANGEEAVVIIFGMFLLLSFIDIAVNSRRKPLAAFAPNGLHDLRGLVVGVVLYLIFLFGFHPYILNIPVI